MSIFHKITDFFIPAPSSGEFIEHDSAPTPKIRTQIEQINEDLAQLIELGEWERALQLARRYNFFNQHFLIAHQAIASERFELVEGALLDVIMGPLRGMLPQAISESGSEEFFYLPRSLYLISYIRSHFQPLHAYQQLTRDFLDLFQENESFLHFKKRFEDQMEHRDQAEQLLYAKRTLEQHIILNHEKIDEIFDLEHHVFSVVGDEIKERPFEDFFADQRILLHNQISEFKRRKNQPAQLQHFQQAQRNIDAYLQGGGPRGYLMTQGKLDVASVIEYLSLDAATSLIRKLELLDYYPVLAYQWYEAGDQVMAYDFMREFVHRTNILIRPHSFADERFKSEIIKFIVHLSQCGPDGCRYQVAYDAAAAWHPQYAMDMIERLSQDDISYNPRDSFVTTVAEPLKNSSQLFFNAQ